MSKGEYGEHVLIEQVARQLQQAGIEYKLQPIVGQARPDLLVKTPDGQTIVLELKDWSSEPENIARAAHQAKRYKELTKAAAAFVVMASLSEPMLPLGVLPVAGLAGIILERVPQILGKRARKKKVITEAPPPDKKIFAAMPFEPKYDDTFLVAMQPAAISVGGVCERVDHVAHHGDVVGQIKHLISHSSAVIADLSESRPNVCYEIGLAEAYEKPVIQICSTSVKKLPFDLRNNATIEYSTGQALKLQKKLILALEKVSPLKT